MATNQSKDSKQLADIIIHRLIVHKVDHKTLNSPILADLETEITEEVAGFIRQHVEANMNHRNASTARFQSNNETERVQELADQILEDSTVFIDRSRRMAQLLFEVQKKKASPSAGEFVVCTFSYSHQSGEQWIALLKMDPQDGFVGHQETIDGLVRIRLERVKDVLPNGELQKCAFIVPHARRVEQECDLIVIDQQNRAYGYMSQVASFFLEDFLNCVRDVNSADLTSSLIKHSAAFADAKVRSGEWSIAKGEVFKQASMDAILNARVDIPAFANQHLEKPDDEIEFVEQFRTFAGKLGRVKTLVFEPDEQSRKKVTRYRKFKGDFGLTVKYRSSQNLPPDFIKVVREEGTTRMIITIRTSTWDEM